ncbi:MAG: sugar ABC transporter substrate-binding protein [Caldilineaceae bacterium]|nr:sugar ABC transporter substrate-binding protein [Caldilineaceae bacterium]
MRHRFVQVSLTGLLIAAFLLAGCTAVQMQAPAGQGAAAEAGPRYSFCVIHNNADHPSITAIVAGMQDEAAAYGDIDLTFYDPAFDPQRQVDQIDDCIALQPNVITVNAVDPAAVVAGLKKAQDAGIPLIMHNADTTEEGRQYSLSYVGAPAIAQGRAVGKAMVESLPDGAKGVVIIGKPGQTDVVLRLQGVRESIDASGKNIEFLDEQPANWMADQALTVMQDFLTRYPSPEVNFVLALDDPMALGALEAIKASGRLDEIKLFGFNGNKEACEAIKNGEMEATALSLSYLTGVYTLRTMRDVALGRLVASNIDSPTTAVTPATVDQWLSTCW